MKKTTLSIFAVFLFTSLFQLNAQNLRFEVTFDDALTNGTEWVYSETTYNKDGEMYISKQGAFVQSPTFEFAITSVLITARHTNTSTDRHDFKLIPITDEGTELDSIDITPNSTDVYSAINVKTPAEEHVCCFRLTCTSGRYGNIYIKSAVISGIPILEAPKDLATSEIYRDRFSASWTPDAAATTHKIEVTKKVETPFTAQYTTKYDLSGLQNTSGSSKEITNYQNSSLPNFEGQSIYIPSNTVGVVQIGSTTKAGILALPPQESYENLKLVIRAKYCDNDPAHEEMPIYYISGDVTNKITEVEFKNAFEIKVVDLLNIPSNTRIALTSPEHNDKRFQIDLLGFATETKEAVSSTELVISTTVKTPHYTAKALEPNTEYSWSVISYGKDGATSKRTQWQSVTTNNLRPPEGFYITVR